MDPVHVRTMYVRTYMSEPSVTLHCLIYILLVSWLLCHCLANPISLNIYNGPLTFVHRLIWNWIQFHKFTVNVYNSCNINRLIYASRYGIFCLYFKITSNNYFLSKSFRKCNLSLFWKLHIWILNPNFVSVNIILKWIKYYSNSLFWVLPIEIIFNLYPFLQEVQNLLQDKKRRLLELNVAVHRYIVTEDTPCYTNLKSEVSELYTLWNETCQR